MLALYLATAAPDLTFWDASELITAARTLGIPHPPGTPLWVLLGRVAGLAFQSSGPARAVTLLSVVASALVGGTAAAMMTRWIGTRGAVAASVSAGAMMTVWANATEAEVYAVALLASAAMLLAAERAGRHDASDAARLRWRAMIVFIAGLAVPLHLSVLVAVPTAVALAWRGRRPTLQDGLSWVAILLLGLSAVAILPLLSAQHPALDSGHPVNLQALLDVLRRTQYEVAGLWPRRAPLWLQLGNVFEWADWQVAFGLSPAPPPSWARTPLTLAWVLLALLGVRRLWRHDARVGRAMVVLLVTGTIGVACWLNLRAGPSYGAGVLAEGALHEARERDYFFVLAFWGWGLCAGAGLSAIAAVVGGRLGAGSAWGDTERVEGRRAVALLSLRSSVLSSLPYLLAAVPLIANRAVMDRTGEPAATLPRTFARLLLEAVPPNGVLYSAGDNDSFPLWYLQQVEAVRTDVLVVTVPMLGARWYREELVRRHNLMPVEMATTWRGLETTLVAITASASAARRPIRVSVLLSAADRRRIDPRAAWALEGLVYSRTSALSPGEVGLDASALRRLREQVPNSALQALPPHLDAAYPQMQALLRCPQVTSVASPLLVGTCNGS